MQKLIANLLVPKITLIVALLYSVLVLTLSLIKTEEIPVSNFENTDKIFHGTAYFGFTVLWYLYYYSKRSWIRVYMRPLIIICLLAIAFGILVEVLQGEFTDYRTVDSFDVLANTTGVFLAFLLILFMKEKLEKVKTRL